MPDSRLEKRTGSAFLNKLLGREYLAEFEAAVKLILEGPERLRIDAPPGIRRYHLRRFPVTIHYRVMNESVQIVAIAHKRKRPSYWAARI